MTRRAATAVAGLLTATLLLAGCGQEENASDLNPDDNPAGESSTDSSDMGSMDMSSVNDPDATPAYDLPDAVEGDFQVLDSAPPGSEGVTGQAWLAQGGEQGGTTVSVELDGLEAGSTYMAHLHAEPCGTDEGGPHFQFEEGGAETPPNEVHLALEADDEGVATATATNDQEVGDGARSIVVHPTDLPDNRLVCADF
ncbi:superoxide dismutase family protein [Nocardioides sp. CFH 31398]|uniref:superoxide dismutase family protein n=1 Tax=Nocardioides sp. CFH 31398 TaxID=2919579 RepID=UPI001F063C14|nr:superoxide dismutase family protein [Nocardioides sp. CFH 31398]MCH1867867.1 superoxide dismutase family protein [Nocardioides sp. CFH 31398]